MLFLPRSSFANWSAQPIEVHEWGVNTFDWDLGKPLVQDFPDYLYTDQRPGEVIGAPAERVRDLRADSGMRTKPILYFYPSSRVGRGPMQATVGVEMRFAYGYANAWWPQVHRYRTEDGTKKVGAPDWEGWKGKAFARWKMGFLGNNTDGKATERWEKALADYRKLNPEDQIPHLVQHGRWSELPELPEDGRMQLVWDELTLHPKVPEGQTLPGETLKGNHWAKIAREVDAAYVSNGKETERYVFYEGKTREEPVIALLPADGGTRSFFWGGARSEKKKEVSVVNVGRHPIYDVFAIYRNREKGIVWTGHLPVMNPREVALRIPDFENPGEGDDLKISPENFRRRTSGRLIENLIAGTPVHAGKSMMRDPADPQGPTKLHQLFRKEATGLEKIWHDEFFESDGLTVIYRESPEYLDEAMPLNVFTSMFWYVQLSRCGLVLNRNLPLEEVYQTDEALYEFQLAGWNEHLKKNLETAMPQLKKNRLLTLGQARFHLPDVEEEEPTQLKEIRKLLE